MLLKSHEKRTICVVVVLMDIQGMNERGETIEGGNWKHKSILLRVLQNERFENV